MSREDLEEHIQEIVDREKEPEPIQEPSPEEYPCEWCQNPVGDDVVVWEPDNEELPEHYFCSEDHKIAFYEDLFRIDRNGEGVGKP